MAEAAREAMWLVLVTVFGILGSRAGVLGITVGVTVASFIFLVSMTHLAHSILSIQLLEWLKTMRAGIFACIVMGLSILAVKNLFDEFLPSGYLLVILVCSGSFAYVVAMRIWLTREDNDFLDLVCGILPTRPAGIIRSILGITSRRLTQETEGKVPA